MIPFENVVEPRKSVLAKIRILPTKLGICGVLHLHPEGVAECDEL